MRRHLAIAFAFVATHNHFVLDRGGKVFKQSAPVIKLPEGATEDDHLALLGVLNSSTACFWLKQVSHNKGNGGDRRRYHKTKHGRTSTSSPAPSSRDSRCPPTLPLEFGRELDALAQRLAALEPSAVCDVGCPLARLLDAARAEHESHPESDDRPAGRTRLGRLPALRADLRRRGGRADRGARDRSGAQARGAGLRDRPRAADGARGGRDAVVRAASVDADHRDPGALAGGVPARSSRGGSRSSSGTGTSG